MITAILVAIVLITIIIGDYIIKDTIDNRGRGLYLIFSTAFMFAFIITMYLLSLDRWLSIAFTYLMLMTMIGRIMFYTFIYRYNKVDITILLGIILLLLLLLYGATLKLIGG